MGLERLMVQAAAASAGVRKAGDRARMASVEAIRTIEGRLIRALDGAHLRGMTRLAEGFEGANVRATGKYGVDTFPRAGERALVLSKDGRLWTLEMSTTAPGSHGLRVATDAELQQPGDLQAYVRTVRIALHRHMGAAERTERTHARAADLAERLQRALAGDDPR